MFSRIVLFYGFLVCIGNSGASIDWSVSSISFETNAVSLFYLRQSLSNGDNLPGIFCDLFSSPHPISVVVGSYPLTRDATVEEVEKVLAVLGTRSSAHSECVTQMLDKLEESYGIHMRSCMHTDMQVVMDVISRCIESGRADPPKQQSYRDDATTMTELLKNIRSALGICSRINLLIKDALNSMTARLLFDGVLRSGIMTRKERETMVKAAIDLGDSLVKFHRLITGENDSEIFESFQSLQNYQLSQLTIFF